jgi:type VI secretion system secreted protein VgrG
MLEWLDRFLEAATSRHPMGRLLTFASVAGPHAFVVQRARGREALGRTPECRLELLSPRADLAAESLLGTPGTLTLEREPGQPPRHFHGYVTRLRLRGPVRTPAFGGAAGYLYGVTLHPGLWFLSRRSDCRIFRGCRLGDLLVDRLAADVGAMTVQPDLGETEWRDQVVQYRETDLDFVSRLAEHIGACWHVVHGVAAHCLVLTDRPGGAPPGEPVPVLRLQGTGAGSVPTLRAFELSREVQPGTFAGSDHHYVTPWARVASAASDPQAHAFAGFEQFDAPLGTGTSRWADAYARRRLEALTCRHAIARGQTVSAHLQAGRFARIEAHPVAGLNGEWLVTAHRFTAVNNLDATGDGAGAEFLAEFEAVPASVPFRPERVTPRPRVAGTQAATVVSDFRSDVADESAEEPLGARLARVRVAFPWDRRGSASCWARVSQPWAGKGCGFQNMPRLGDEVLVQFHEGDPDRPVVIGRVHNGASLPPYALPRQAAVTGLRTASLDADGRSVVGRFNEWRFDDALGAEQVYVQAQRDLDERVLHDRHASVAGECHSVVHGDRVAACLADLHASVAGDLRAAVGGALSASVARDLLLHAGGGRVALDAAQQVHVRAGASVVIEAATRLTLRVGASFIEIDPSGVRIDGPLVSLKCGGGAAQAEGASPTAPRAAAEALCSDGTRPPAEAPP